MPEPGKIDVEFRLDAHTLVEALRVAREFEETLKRIEAMLRVTPEEADELAKSCGCGCHDDEVEDNP